MKTIILILTGLLFAFTAQAAYTPSADGYITTGTTGNVPHVSGSGVLTNPNGTASTSGSSLVSGTARVLSSAVLSGGTLTLTGSGGATISIGTGGVSWPLLSTDGTIDIGNTAPGTGTQINLNADGSLSAAQEAFSVDASGNLTAYSVMGEEGDTLLDLSEIVNNNAVISFYRLDTYFQGSIREYNGLLYPSQFATGGEPSASQEGGLVYDSTLHKMKFWKIALNNVNSVVKDN